MLHAILEGLAEDADTKGLAALIRDTTGILPRAARSKVQQLGLGEAVIIAVPAESLRSFLHRAESLGVATADMIVKPVDE